MVSQIPFWTDILSFKCLLTPNNFFELFKLRPSLRESKQSELKSNRVQFSCYSLCTLMSWIFGFSFMPLSPAEHRAGVFCKVRFSTSKLNCQESNSDTTPIWCSYFLNLNHSTSCCRTVPKPNPLETKAQSAKWMTAPSQVQVCNNTAWRLGSHLTSESDQQITSVIIRIPATRIQALKMFLVTLEGYSLECWQSKIQGCSESTAQSWPGGLRHRRASVCSRACRDSASSTTVQPRSPSSFRRLQLGLPSGSSTCREHCSKSRGLWNNGRKTRHTPSQYLFLRKDLGKQSLLDKKKGF